MRIVADAEPVEVQGSFECRVIRQRINLTRPSPAFSGDFLHCVLPKAPVEPSEETLNRKSETGRQSRALGAATLCDRSGIPIGITVPGISDFYQLHATMLSIKVKTLKPCVRRERV